MLTASHEIAAITREVSAAEAVALRESVQDSGSARAQPVLLGHWPVAPESELRSAEENQDAHRTPDGLGLDLTWTAGEIRLGPGWWL